MIVFDHTKFGLVKITGSLIKREADSLRPPAIAKSRHGEG